MAPGSAATPHSISSLNFAGVMPGTVTSTLSNGSTSKVLFSVMLPAGIELRMPPPLENATLATGRPSATAVRLTPARNASATRSPRLDSFWRIGFGLPPSSSTSVVPITFAARLALYATSGSVILAFSAGSSAA